MNKVSRFFLSNASAKNSFWIIAERAISVGITAFLTVLSARYLGTEQYGFLSYGLTLTTLFMGIMKLGLDSIMVNELISNKNRQGEFLGTSMVLRLISGILSIVMIFILLSLVNGNEKLLITVAMIQSLVLIFQSFSVLDFWFQSELKSKFVSIAKIIGTLTVSVYSLYVLFLEKGVVWFAASIAITASVVSFLLLIFYAKQPTQKLFFSLGAAKHLLSKSHHFIVASIISLLYVQIDKVMINNMIGSTDLGLYSAAMVLCTAWLFLPESITTSLRPGIMRAKLVNESQYEYKLRRLYFIIFWLSMVCAAIISLTAPIVVPILFGKEFVAAIPVVQLAAWYAPLSALGVARGVWIVSEEKYKYSKYYLALGLLLNIILNLLLIPLMGIVGAAVSTLLTEIVSCFVAPLFFKATRMHPGIVLNAIIRNPKRRIKDAKKSI